MRISGIYQIQSKVKSERIYIGSAQNIRSRWLSHIHDLKKNKHGNSRLQNHFNKYGESDLIFIIVELCFPEFLTAREQYYMNKLKPYFNIRKIAGSNLGLKQSEETIRKKIESLTGKHWHHSEETKKKYSDAKKGNKYNLGRHPSEETKQKIRLKLKGRKHSEEENEKNRQSHLGKKHSEEAKLKMRKPKLKKVG